MSLVSLLVEVDVALARPPRRDAQVWVWVLVTEGPYRSSAQVEAEQTAILMAMSNPRVVMAVGARVIDWEHPVATDA